MLTPGESEVKGGLITWRPCGVAGDGSCSGSQGSATIATWISPLEPPSDSIR